MGVITSLNVVNSMLSSIGEVGVNSLLDGHPLVNKGLTFLHLANITEQGKGWWFNTECITLNPTDDGEILTPKNIIQLDPLSSALDYTERAGKLYKLNAGTGSPTQFDGPVTLVVVRLVDFEDLPTNAQLLVQHSASLDFLNDMDGDASKVQKITNRYREAMITLKADHIRSVDVNFLNNPSLQSSLNSIIGSSTGRLRIR